MVALKQVASSPTRDILYLGAIQWPWSLAPTWGLVLHSLEQIVDGFSRDFMPETLFLCRFNMLYVIHACWIFFFFFFVILDSKKKIGKNSSLCVFLFLLNSMLFGEK